jgi:hypothetical protein
LLLENLFANAPIVFESNKIISWASSIASQLLALPSLVAYNWLHKCAEKRETQNAREAIVLYLPPLPSPRLVACSLPKSTKVLFKITYDEIKHKLLCWYAIDLSPSTLNWTHHRLHLPVTRKTVVVRAQERSFLLPGALGNRMGDLVINPWMFVFLDESSKNERTLIWRYG